MLINHVRVLHSPDNKREHFVVGTLDTKKFPLVKVDDTNFVGGYLWCIQILGTNYPLFANALGTPSFVDDAWDKEPTQKKLFEAAEFNLYLQDVCLTNQR